MWPLLLGQQPMQGSMPVDALDSFNGLGKAERKPVEVNL
jgi:hypothetical protein